MSFGIQSYKINSAHYFLSHAHDLLSLAHYFLSHAHYLLSLAH